MIHAHFEIKFLQAIVKIKLWKKPDISSKRRRSHFGKSKKLTVYEDSSDDNG